MKVLAIDPGETVGLVLLEERDDGQVVVHDSLDILLRLFKKFLPKLLAKADVIVIEDYRIFATHSKEHIGVALITPELIGYVEAHCDLKSILFTRLQPNEKGHWPEARMKAKHPKFQDVVGHARDALKIGLVYIEKGGS